MKLGDMLDAAEATVFAARQAASVPQVPVRRAAMYVHAGQLFASPDPCDITTILGSCVSVCLWDSRAGVGGINHFVLPSDLSHTQPGPRFANFAVPKLIDMLVGMGADRRRLKAKLYGGASVLKPHHSSDLGTRNIEAGRSLLEGEGIPIVEEDVGGDRGLKILFHSADGATTVKRL